MENIQVSIICNTYNQESYVTDALESFVSQKTTFAYEVLVHDDASTDGTADIIREYEAKYPDLIKPIYQKVNQYSQKVSITAIFQIPRAKGKYLAFCEGDDYWTDPYKLQKQYDAMEQHPEVDICAHTAFVVDAETKNPIKTIQPRQQDCIIPVEDVIYGEGGFVATNSLMLQRDLNENIPEFRRMLPYDYTLQINGALRGGMLYLSDAMSAYRTMAKGSWSQKMAKDNGAAYKFHLRKQGMLRQLNLETNGQYDAVIQKRLLKNEMNMLLKQEAWRQAIQKQYRCFFREFSFSDKVKIYIKAILCNRTKRT